MFGGIKRRHAIGFAIVVVLVASYAAAGFLGVPRFARSGLQGFVSSHYGRALSVGEIRFNPFTLVFEVDKLSFPDVDGQPMLAFGRLRVRLAVASLWRWAPSFREILLEDPLVRTVIRPDRTLNLADLAKGFASAGPKAGAAKAGPFKLFIDQLALSSGTTLFEDRSRPTPFRTELTPIALELHSFSTGTGSENAYELSAASPEGERLRWTGTLRVEPFSARGHFEVEDLHAQTVWRYLRDLLPFEVSSGIIGVKGDYEVRPEGHSLGVEVNVHDTTVTQLGLRPRRGTTDYVNLGRIELRDTRMDLAERSVGIKQVRVAGGEVRAWLDPQGSLNLRELLARQDSAAAASSNSSASQAPAAAAPATDASASHASAATAPASQASWKLAVPDIAVEGVKVSAEDRQVTPAVALGFDPLKIHVSGFSTAPEAPFDIALESGINGSGTLSATARVSRPATAVKAHAELAQVDLTGFQPYIARRTALTLLSGLLAAKLDIERGADGNVAATGDTTITGLSTVDNELKQDFIKWKELHAIGVRYVLRPASLTVDTIVAREPYARVIIAPDRTINVKEVLGGPRVAQGGAVGASKGDSGSSAQAQSASRSPTLAISINHVQIVNGSARYADFWIQPNFAVGILSLNGSVDGLSSDPRSRAKVQLEGKVDRYAPVHIAGTANLLAATADTDITMSFKGLELTTITPYSGHFAGYKIDKGKLSAELHYTIKKRQLNAEHRFVIDQLQLGEQVESAAAVKLPLKLAVALLKDRNGVIDIGLPLSGSLDDPEFEIGPIVWKAVIHLLERAVTAPFALLGHLFGGGEEMKFVDFAPGSAQLDAPAKEKLASLSKALQERPHLQLDVPAAFSPDLDRAALAAARLREKLVKLARNRQALTNPPEHFRLLVTQFRSDFGKSVPLPASAAAVDAAKSRKQPPPYEQAIADLEAALAERIEVPDAELQTLGSQRAEAIKAALLSGTGIDPSRVFTINAPPNPDSGDSVRLELALK